MKNKKIIVTFALILALSLTLVACSDSINVYNEAITENPTSEQITDFINSNGGGVSSIMKSDSKEPAGEGPADMDPAMIIGMLTPELQAKVDEGEMTQEKMDEIIAGVESGDLGMEDIMAIMN